MSSAMYNIDSQAIKLTNSEYFRNSSSFNNDKNIHLDSEFDQHLANMKKFILELKDKRAKQLCAIWVKKLCEISDTESLSMKAIRNIYSNNLLKMLENKQDLISPFNELPPNGPLKLSDDSSSTINVMLHHQNSEMNINNNTNTSTNYLKQENCGEQTLNLESDSLINIYQYTTNTNLDQSNMRDEKIKNYQNQNFDCQMMRLIEAKFKEEKILIQQTHNIELQKIIDRKNNEIENLKMNFGKNKKDYEESIVVLEQKIQHLSKEIYTNEEEYDRQINYLKNQVVEITEKKQFESDKKLKEIVNSYEKEKFDLQKQHTKAFQDLVDETNLRLKKVESEYNEQQNLTDKVISELENRIQLLKNEMDKNTQIMNNLEFDLKNKNAQIEMLDSKVKDIMSKNAFLENENQMLKDKNSKDLSQMESIFNTKCQDYENTIQKINQSLHDLEKLRTNLEKKLDKSNFMLKEKEALLKSANIKLIQQKQQAETALNELKKEIESNSTRLYNEMKEQMIKIENDLDKSREAKDKQLKESLKAINELKTDNMKQIEKINQENDREKYELKKEFELEKQKMIKDHEKAYNDIQNEFQQQIMQNNQRYISNVDSLTNTISQLESKFLNLEQELIESDRVRKQQITELGLLRQEEKEKLIRNHELEKEKIKSAYEEEKSTLIIQLKHQCENSNEELKSLKIRLDEQEKRFDSEKNILEDKIKILEAEKNKNLDNIDREKNNFVSKVEEEKNSLQKHYQIIIKKLEKELELEKNRTKIIENKYKSINAQHQHNIIHLKMQYEEKLKGLLPIGVKKDLEDTISAMKNQVDCLQHRIILLQSELDDRNNFVNSSSYTASLITIN